MEDPKLKRSKPGNADTKPNTAIKQELGLVEQQYAKWKKKPPARVTSIKREKPRDVIVTDADYKEVVALQDARLFAEGARKRGKRSNPLAIDSRSQGSRKEVRVRLEPRHCAAAREAGDWFVRTAYLAVVLAIAARADGTSIDIKGITYPSGGCSPPALIQTVESPHFLDRAFSVEFRVAISPRSRMDGYAQINERITTASHLPAISDAGSAAGESVYHDAYFAIAESVVRGSRFLPATCDGRPATVAAVVVYRFNPAADSSGPALGCTNPAVIYKPEIEDDGHGPRAHIVADVVVDVTGKVANVQFTRPVQIEQSPNPKQSPPIGRNKKKQPEPPPAVDWVAEYQKRILIALEQWKFRPATCGDSPVAKPTVVDFYIRWQGLR